MSMDKSLKTSGALSKHRNVLKRAERIEKLQEEERWQEDQSPFGLIKVANRKVTVGGKEKKKKEGTEGEGEGESATPAEGTTEDSAKK